MKLSRRQVTWAALALAPILVMTLVKVASAKDLSLSESAGKQSAGEQSAEEQSAGEETTTAQAIHGWLAIQGDRVLALENADQRLVPASVNKLIVSAAALHFLGPDYRLTTQIQAMGKIGGGVLTGDLVVVAAGDPTWNRRFHRQQPRRPLAQLARQIHERGVRRVTGDLVIDASRFPGRPWPLSRALDEFPYAWAAPASALAIDENSIAIDIAPGAKEGDSGSASGAPGVDLRHRISTVGRHRHERGTVSFLPIWNSRALVIDGEYPLSEPSYRVQASMPSPDLFAGEALAAELAAVGIELGGSVRVTRRPAPAAESIASWTSPPLSAWLVPILTDSHNWYAEMLLRILAAEQLGEGRDDLGLDLERQLLTETVGIDAGSFHLDDASGISPYNLLTPRTTVELLRWIWRQPWRATFIDALAAPGSGTLGEWPRLPALAAKTGTGRHTLALAGYLRPAEAAPIIFAIFVNHATEERPRLRAQMAARLFAWSRL